MIVVDEGRESGYKHSARTGDSSEVIREGQHKVLRAIYFHRLHDQGGSASGHSLVPSLNHEHDPKVFSGLHGGDYRPSEEASSSM
jgi:hypothetical protein